MAKKRRKLTRRELQRIATSKERGGEDVFRNGGYKTAQKRWGWGGVSNPL